MIVIDHLYERLDTAAARTLLFTHATGNGFWVTINTGHESMSVALGVSTIVLVIHNYCLAASILASQQKHHLTGSHNLTHFEKILTENVGVPKKMENKFEKQARSEKTRLHTDLLGKRKSHHNTLTAL